MSDPQPTYAEVLAKPKGNAQLGQAQYAPCAACHGMQYVPLRTLADEGGPHLPEDQVRAYAAQFDIYDE